MTESNASRRVSRAEEKLVSEGGRIIRTLRLKPDAAKALARLESEGESATKIINRLLVREAK